ALCADRRDRCPACSRRPHPGGASRGLAGGQFEPGRRHEGQLHPRRTPWWRGGWLMLSRTAAHLYWIGRYMERAEFICRLIEATIRLTALGDHATGDRAWRSALSVVGVQADFERSGEAFSAPAARRYLTLSEENPGSIRSCLAAARDNARAARTALSV